MQSTHLYIPYSYTPTAPTIRKSSLLGPLRKRQYQTRQQQIRYGTNTRIGAAPLQRDEHPLTGQLIQSEPCARPDRAILAAEDASDPPSAPSCTTTTTSSSSSLQCSHPRAPSSASHLPPPSSAPSHPSTNSFQQQQQQRSSMGQPARPCPVTKSIFMMGQAMRFRGGSASSACGPDSSTAHSLATSCSSSCSTSSSSSSSSSSTSASSCGDASLNLRRMSSPSLSAVYKMDAMRTSGAASVMSRSSSASSSTVYAPSAVSAHSLATWVAGGTTSSSSSCCGSDHESSDPAEYGRVSPVEVAELVSERLPLIMSEREHSLANFDKVFALSWLTDEDLLLGTKCNQVMLLNTRTDRRVILSQLGDSLTWSPKQVQKHLQEHGYPKAKMPVSGNNSSSTARPLSYASILSRVQERTAPSNFSLSLFNTNRRSSTPPWGAGSTDLANNLSSLAIRQTSSNATSLNTNSDQQSTSATAASQQQQQLPATTDLYQQQLSSSAGGVRSIVISPSRTMVAIGAGEPYNVAIYSLPEFEPIGMLHGHTDLVFSLKWVSDTVLVSASRDGSLRVWSLESEPFTELPSVLRPINVWDDVLVREEEKVKVRELAYNRRSGQLMTLNTDGYVKLWDRETYQRVSKIKLVHYSEAVCLAMNPYVNLYAVGSQAHISIIDPRAASTVHIMDSVDEGWGVRSLDFKSHIVTTGGGYGRIGFYDLRAQRYLDGFDNGTSTKRYRDIADGWLHRETASAGGMAGFPIRNAVYAMEYDDTGTRLFTAGGPLQLGLCGSYAALWS